ncbi:MAG: hypothetical protein NUV67_00465 [archaeon]|nr:hypothetical protein [archaeon]
MAKARIPVRREKPISHPFEQYARKDRELSEAVLALEKLDALDAKAIFPAMKIVWGTQLLRNNARWKKTGETQMPHINGKRLDFMEVPELKRAFSDWILNTYERKRRSWETKKKSA